jgi:glucose/arabinose dehydrogenase
MQVISLLSALSRRHRIVIGAAAVLTWAALPITASAAPLPLISAPTGFCLDVTGNDATPRTLVQIWPCHSQSNQQWDLTAAGELRTFGGTRCLDVRGASTEPRAVVQSTTCNGGANQKWSLKSDGTVVGVQSGLCLTVIGGGRSAGTGIDIWPCQGASHQKWTRDAAGSADTQAPTPPSGLKIANLACRSATLSWNASSDNVGVAFYDIYHDGQLITSVAGSTTSTSLPLTPGVNWGLYVNGRDAAGNVSQASATLPVAVPQCVADTQSPTTPTGLQGSAAGTTVTLKWVASSDNIGVVAYDVFRNDSKVGSTANLSFTDSGLAANTSFRYTVAARDAQNNVSGRSTNVSVKTGNSCSGAVCSVNQVTTETDVPWGLVTLPDGNILYSRRDAKDIILLNPTTGNKTNVGTVPNVEGTDGEGGLLGLAVTPNFPANDPWLYVYHTSASDNRIVRIRYANGSIDTSSVQVLLQGIGKNKFHNGGRLRFGPDGKLYAAVGDAQEPGKNPQDKNNLNGKILRLNADGSKPADNPFNNYVWSFGHRNPQGLAFDSQGRLWAQEFGDGNEDETNLIERGGNYGYPNCEGTVSQGGSGCGTAGYIAPKAVYKTADASCSGIAIVRDVLYVACQRGTRVYRHVISGSSLTRTQQLFSGTYGRIRTVEPSIDGNLWMATTNGGDKDNVPNNSDNKVFKVILGN